MDCSDHNFNPTVNVLFLSFMGLTVFKIDLKKY